MPTPCRSRTRRPVWLAVPFAAVFVSFAIGVSSVGPRFYQDDPISREPESQDASKAEPYEIGQIYEMVYNLFVTPSYKASGSRARNLNTIDEVPDSSWFTNRIGHAVIT